MKISKPNPHDISEYYQSYLKYVPEDDVLNAFLAQLEITNDFLISIPAKKTDFAYAPGKWMLKEVVGHLSDTERILTYRALRFSRKDATPLPGFDENIYTPNSNYNERTFSSIVEEKFNVRKAGISFFENLREDMYDRTGIANDNKVSVKAILFFILGHERHHVSVIKERYL